MLLLCFYGLPRSGKDTAAEHLATARQLHRVSFGAGIYEEASKAFGVTVEQLGSHVWKTEPHPELALKHCNDVLFVPKALKASDLPSESYHEQMSAPRTSRFILQRWATEYRRAQDPLYWVKRLDDTLKRQIRKDGLRDIVISDLREFHEYQYVHNLSSEMFIPLRVIEVVREGTVSSGHSSDNALPKWCIDRRITNDDIDQFRAEVEKVVDGFRNPSFALKE